MWAPTKLEYGHGRAARMCIPEQACAPIWPPHPHRHPHAPHFTARTPHPRPVPTALLLESTGRAACAQLLAGSVQLWTRLWNALSPHVRTGRDAKRAGAASCCGDGRVASSVRLTSVRDVSAAGVTLLGWSLGGKSLLCAVDTPYFAKIVGLISGDNPRRLG